MSVLDQATPARHPDVRNYIAGTFVDAPERDLLDVTDPSDGTLLSRVPLSGEEEVARAVEAAEKAAPGWAGTAMFRMGTVRTPDGTSWLLDPERVASRRGGLACPTASKT